MAGSWWLSRCVIPLLDLGTVLALSKGDMLSAPESWPSGVRSLPGPGLDALMRSALG